MDMTTLQLTLWIASGAFIGGVVTPVVADNRKINEWAATLIGVVLGAAGNVALLLPMWVVVGMQPRRTASGPAWQRDAADPQAALAELSTGQAASPAATGAVATDSVTPGELMAQTGAWLGSNFWPQAREHSHRMEYVRVFVALGVITMIEVLLSVWDSAPVDMTVPLVLLSTAKVMLVVLFFMHLRYDSKWYSWIFAFSLPFAIIVLTVLAVA